MLQKPTPPLIRTHAITGHISRCFNTKLIFTLCKFIVLFDKIRYCTSVGHITRVFTPSLQCNLVTMSEFIKFVQKQSFIPLNITLLAIHNPL